MLCCLDIAVFSFLRNIPSFFLFHFIFQFPFLLPTNKVWCKVDTNLFTGVCLSTGSWLPNMHHRSHDWGSASRAVCIRGSALRGVGQTPPSGLPTGGSASGVGGQTPRDTLDTSGYDQQAGSTHPIGMLSCFIFFFFLLSFLLPCIFVFFLSCYLLTFLHFIVE